MSSNSLLCKNCNTPNKEPVYADYSHLPEIQRSLGNLFPISYKPIKCKCLTRGKVLVHNGKYLDYPSLLLWGHELYTEKPFIFEYNTSIRAIIDNLGNSGLYLNCILVLGNCKLITVILPKK